MSIDAWNDDDGGLGGPMDLEDGSSINPESIGFRVQGAGCRVQGAGLRVQGAGYRVQGVGFRV